MDWTIEVAPGDMLLFAAVVHEGSFTAAARALGLTKQSVSERVARLEHRLGVRLLERTTRRMRPTDAGAAYAERCHAIAVHIREANDAVRERHAQPVGRLRVAAPVLYGRRMLSPVLALYAARFPQVHVELTLTDRRVDLIADGFDVAIQIGRLPDSPYTARRLDDGVLYLVASPSYLAAHGVPTASTLSSARCLGLRDQETWRVGEQEVRIAPALVVNDLEALTMLAIAGAGIARVPSLVSRDAVEDGRLVRLFADAPATRRPVWAVYADRRFLGATVQRFLECLTENVALMPTA